VISVWMHLKTMSKKALPMLDGIRKQLVTLDKICPEIGWQSAYKKWVHCSNWVSGIVSRSVSVSKRGVGETSGEARTDGLVEC
jgi:hypothetical protein